jgi:cardiolipin synthase
MADKKSFAIKNLGIPNMLSIFRLILIPVFFAAYFSALHQSGIISAVILIISGITDVLDGVIARKFNMTTELGRVLDPFADKLTQASICICLVIKKVAPFWLLILIILKEFVMIIAGANIIKKGKEMMSSKWFGKIATCVFYSVMITIIVFRPSSEITNVLIAVILVFMLFSLSMYTPIFFRIISKKVKT